MAGEQPQRDAATGTVCPECDKQTIRGSDKCHHCGAPVDSGETISLAMWEYGGGLIAAFGFFMTPVITGLPAIYCAYKVYDRSPNSAYGILAVFISTIIFWIVLPTVILPG